MNTLLTVTENAPLFVHLFFALVIIGGLLYLAKYFGTTLQYQGVVMEIKEEKTFLERRLAALSEESSIKEYKVTVKGEYGLKTVVLSPIDAQKIRKGSIIIVSTRGSWNAPPQDDRLVGVIKY